MAQLPQLRMTLHQLQQPLTGRVRRAVIDVDDLVGPAAVERAGNFLDQRRDIVGLVTHGHDDGNGDLGVGGRQIGAHRVGWLADGTAPAVAATAYYEPNGLRATLLKRSKDGPGSG